MWKLKDFLEGKVTEKERMEDRYEIYKNFREENMQHFKMCFRYVHEKFLEKCPIGLYGVFFPRYRVLMPRARKEGKLKIEKRGNKWLIQRQDMTLLSPTPNV
jgi:hypothetical protein